MIVKAGPIAVFKKGGQGLNIDKITMYKENKHAIVNSTQIWITPTSYDHIERKIAIGRTRKPFKKI